MLSASQVSIKLTLTASRASPQQTSLVTLHLYIESFQADPVPTFTAHAWVPLTKGVASSGLKTGFVFWECPLGQV